MTRVKPGRKLADQYLPSPVVRDYAAVSTQNSQFRTHIEDECVAIPKYRAFPDDPAVSSYFGVYDGHGGGLRQQRNRSNVTTTSSIDNCSAVEIDVLSNADIESYTEAFSYLEKELENFDESSESGSTVVICLIRKYNGRTTFHIANVGDSRAIFCCNGQTSRLSVEHKATNEDEADENKFISSAPHIESLELAPNNAFLLLVSEVSPTSSTTRG
ncbi:unnamed protein product [Peronospora destructor]|uniref:protein-serine/threonine phosphatase n=1 Tax=Peronospora destructor TaxID=86335 RepID=A0AAV0TCM2_9STRA|nr:unnamed protein product [Peronospora destructor]